MRLISLSQALRLLLISHFYHTNTLNMMPSKDERVDFITVCTFAFHSNNTVWNTNLAEVPAWLRDFPHRTMYAVHSSLGLFLCLSGYCWTDSFVIFLTIIYLPVKAGQLCSSLPARCLFYWRQTKKSRQAPGCLLGVCEF